MRRLIALAAVAAIAVVALPAGADSSTQPELRERAITEEPTVDPDAIEVPDVPVDPEPDPADPVPEVGPETDPEIDSDTAEAEADGTVYEIDLPEPDVAIVGVQWDGNPDAELRVSVQAADGTWGEPEEVELPDTDPDPDSDEARAATTARSAQFVSEPIGVDNPAKVRVEIVDDTAIDPELITVTGSSDDGVTPIEAGVIPRTVAILLIAGLAIALMLPRQRNRLTSTASIVVVALGVSVLAAACEPQGPPPGPPILSRAQWGANEGLRLGHPDPGCRTPSYAGSIDSVVIHHTATPNNYGPSDVPARIRSIYSYHVQSLGYCDIAYNFLVDRFGQVWEGRAGGVTSAVIGAHAKGFNTATSGATFIGNHQEAHTTQVAMDRMIQLMAWKMSVHNINPYQPTFRYGQWFDPILGHRDAGHIYWVGTGDTGGQSSCPGQYVFNQMDGIRAKIRSQVVFGNPFGNIEFTGEVAPGQVRVSGWVHDPDTSQPIDIHVYVGGPHGVGHGIFAGPANLSRPDVGAAYPTAGNHHGFNVTGPIVGPNREVCIYAIGFGPGGNPLLGCRPF